MGKNKEKVFDCYQKIAPYYQMVKGIRESNLVETLALENDGVVRLISHYRVDSSRTILALGCGTGEFACYMGLLGYKVVGVDLSPAMLSVANQYKEKYGLSKVVFIAADAGLLELEEKVRQNIGIVFSREMIPHIIEESALQRVFNRLFSLIPSSTIVLFETYTEVGMGIITDAVSHDFGQFEYHQQGIYASKTRRGSIEYTVRDHDQPLPIKASVPIRFWSNESLESMLLQAGFRKIEFFDSAIDVVFSSETPSVRLRPVSPLSEKFMIKAQKL